MPPDPPSFSEMLRMAKANLAESLGTPLPPPLPKKPPPLPAKPPPLPVTTFRSQYLEPALLERFENLLVFARTTVEGYYAGRHKSPHFGFSAEFIEHKPYAPGDETNHIDWRVYARTRRLYSRKYLEETDMTIHLLVDGSASMNYSAEKREFKYSRVARIAAALAYLMLKQGDKAALGLFTDRLIQQIPPGGTRRHLFRLLQALESERPSQSLTDLPRAIQETASRWRKRGRLVVISDFLNCDLDALFDSLAALVHRGCEVLLMQVLDPDELALPNVSLARFVDMETHEEVQVEPEEIRASYEQQIQALTDTLRTQASRRRMDYQLINTASPFLDAIEAYLGFRRR
jgi:uncharacterized protein (DUF58 family)